MRLEAWTAWYGLTISEMVLKVPHWHRRVAAAPPSCVVDRELLLVDDVHTTRATFRTVATALRKAGTTRVEVITLPRAISLA